MAGTVKLEDKQRLAQEEESEAKRLAIMMMKKREKYLYNKIMFGKRRKIREVSLPAPTPHPLHLRFRWGLTAELPGLSALLSGLRAKKEFKTVLCTPEVEWMGRLTPHCP